MELLGSGMVNARVLEAGSAAALNKWMEEHGYKYPAGMDDACNDYVKQGWCFVAVKTKVGPRNGVSVVVRAWTEPDFKRWLLEDSGHFTYISPLNAADVTPTGSGAQCMARMWPKPVACNGRP
mgnify:CR=1 FL=1